MIHDSTLILSYPMIHNFYVDEWYISANLINRVYMTLIFIIKNVQFFYLFINLLYNYWHTVEIKSYLGYIDKELIIIIVINYSYIYSYYFMTIIFIINDIRLLYTWLTTPVLLDTR